MDKRYLFRGMSQIIHMHADIRGMLDHHRRKGSLKGVFKNTETGIGLSDQEARDYLYDCLAKGWRVLPVDGCDNFDYQTGCKGHPIDADDNSENKKEATNST